MRQRLLLAKRIDKLAEQMQANSTFSQISAEAKDETGLNK
jgi:hypothetical protein